jgi:apolipoprotein N-acyltransferase
MGIASHISTPIAPARRFLGVMGAFALLFAASPGVIHRDGSLVLAFIGIAVWAAAAAHPIRERRARSFLAEWTSAAIGFAALMGWAGYVFPAGLLWIGFGQGLYVALAGVLLRRLALRMPFALAVGLAWGGAEVLRTLLEPPLGLGWLLLGHYAHHDPWLSGSARVWGVEGLSLVLAVCAGTPAGLLARPGERLRAAAIGAGALAVTVALSLATKAPTCEPGPTLLLVQPGFEQARKQRGDARANFEECVRQTREALAAREAAGFDPPDLVCWGESMLFTPILLDGTEQSLAAGAKPSPSLEEFTPDDWASLRRIEQHFVGQAVFGPEGPWFLSGAESIGPDGDSIRRRVTIALYDGAGTRRGLADKQHLVPGAETMCGLERFAIVRKLSDAIGGYVADLKRGEETSVLELETRAGERFRFTAAICFDNAFPGAFVEPLRRGPVDFHLVVSNEAWYRRSFEFDQMVAFSRLIAISTGRAVVRATNSGVSLVLSADGREVQRLVVAGEDRAVRGSLAVQVPVPVDAAARSTTPYVRLRPYLRAAILAALVAGAYLLPSRGNRVDAAG